MKTGIFSSIFPATATRSLQQRNVLSKINTEIAANTPVTMIHASCVLLILSAVQLMIGNVHAVTTILAVIDKAIRILLIVSLSCLSRLINDPSV